MMYQYSLHSPGYIRTVLKRPSTPVSILNIGKSKSMAFGTRYQTDHCDPPNVSLGSNKLEVVHHYKYWGTFVDTHLTFTKQGTETCKSVSFKLCCLSKIKKYLDTNLMIELYRAYFQPLFDYNDIFNSTTTSCYQNKDTIK